MRPEGPAPANDRVGSPPVRFSRGSLTSHTPRETACALSENAIQPAVFDNIRVRGAAGVFAFHPRNGSHDRRSLAGINNGLGS